MVLEQFMLQVIFPIELCIPFSITLGYGIGCLISIYLVNKKGIPFYQNKLVPLSAGLIVGEALMGVGHTIYELIAAGGAA